MVAGFLFWTRYPILAGRFLTPHNQALGTEANGYRRRLVIQYVSGVSLSASWNETCYLQVFEIPLPNANFSARFWPLREKRRFAFMPGIIVKFPPTTNAQNLSFIRAETVLRPL